LLDEPHDAIVVDAKSIAATASPLDRFTTHPHHALQR
jgi:hypothetical protein